MQPDRPAGRPRLRRLRGQHHAADLPAYSPGTPDIKRLPPLHTPNIGDRLSAKHVDWAWYSGGWSNANGDVGASGWTNGNGTTCTDPNHNSNAVFPNCPDVDFQYHHQALNYFANYAPGTQARRDHLKDEAEFIQAAKTGRLKQVSFIKPIGEENEHPATPANPRAASTWSISSRRSSKGLTARTR